MTLEPKLMANALRALAMDAVQHANSGHPGAPMGMADMAQALWHDHLQHAPTDPKWPNRDRFVLSNGHASMLLYGLLHLTGYDLPMKEIENFRQLHSRTPGHPEVGVTPGVETTTGPLGQGLANAVGMALAEKLLAHEFNRDGFEVVNHHTYAFLGDGCLMEGVSHEVCSLAGAWHLNKLIALYDDNGISIDGQVKPWFADHTAERFKAYGWQVLGPVDGHDAQAVSQAIANAKHSATAPTLIICKTHIGKGSPNRGNTAKAHGEPLGEAEIALTRETLGWSHAPFSIPPEVYAMWDAKAPGAQKLAQWNALFASYAHQHPELAHAFEQRMKGVLSAEFKARIEEAFANSEAQGKAVASRMAGKMALEVLTAMSPELLGGSADLTGSNLTQALSQVSLRFDAHGHVQVTPLGDGPAQASNTEVATTSWHINYGVREFGMAAIMNGVALHGGFIPYGGTFLTFSDYSRNAIRMAALMKLRVVHVFTHDSIGLGEDGPTHQSVEHAASLRLIPGLDVWRPSDTSETLVAWASAIQNQHRPSALLLSRQTLPHTPKKKSAAIEKGGYVLTEPKDVGLKKDAVAVLIATGSEVGLALSAQKHLGSLGIAVRVVSMPCTQAFDRQPMAYRQKVLPAHLPRVAVEMGVSDYWWKYGVSAVVGIDTFGESAPANALLPLFGFTPENVAQTVQAVLQKHA